MTKRIECSPNLKKKTLFQASLSFLFAVCWRPKHLPFVQTLIREENVYAVFPNVYCVYFSCACFDWQLYMTLNFNFI